MFLVRKLRLITHKNGLFFRIEELIESVGTKQESDGNGESGGNDDGNGGESDDEND